MAHTIATRAGSRQTDNFIAERERALIASAELRQLTATTSSSEYMGRTA